jgi:hypothetical protein
VTAWSFVWKPSFSARFSWLAGLLWSTVLIATSSCPFPCRARPRVSL